MRMPLTSAGWPRPIVDGWPVPWVSPSEELAVMDSGREAAAASGSICAVCGGDYLDDVKAYSVVRKSIGVDLSAVEVQPMDNGIMHKRCLQLALAKCPRLRELSAEDSIEVVSVPGNSTRIEIVDGKHMARIDGKLCRIVTDQEDWFNARSRS